MKLPKSAQEGFTIVEVITATAIAGILIIVIMVFTVNSFAQISIDGARSNLLSDAQISLDTATRDIRMSSGAEENNHVMDENAPGNNDLSWESTDSTLVLATAALDNNNTILFEDPLHYTSWKNNIVYYVQDGSLYRRQLAVDAPDNALKTTCPPYATTADCHADTKLVDNVSSFQVRYIDGDGDEVDPSDARSIDLTLRLHIFKYNRDISAEYKTRTVFRNE